jgi:hypothetical protein
VLFIESERHQALEIARIAGKPVLTIDTGEMIRPGALSPIAVAQSARNWPRDAARKAARTLLGDERYKTLKKALKSGLTA